MAVKTRTFDYEGRQVRFSYDCFRLRFNAYKEHRELTRTELKNRIASECCVSESAVNNWLCKKNGPGDMETIKIIADVLETSVDDLIVKADDKEGTDIEMGYLSDRQREAVRRIYAGITTFLDEFQSSDGFGNYYCLGVYDIKINNRDEMYEMIDKKINNLLLLLKCEYLDLQNCGIYTELYDFIEGDLIDIYDGKVDYAYRFENGGTSEDYTKASDRLIEIVNKYW